jgi:molecular chaperone GrpE
MAAKREKRDVETSIEQEEGLAAETAETLQRPDLENELRTTVERLQRLQAEFENYKKRAARDAAAYEQRVSDRVILDFLPLYDNLQRAFHSLSSNGDHETFVEGVEQIFGQFQQVLEAKEVQRIETEGRTFDPEMHEAMLSVPCDLEKNRIVEEFMPGYVRNERVLRPSKVSVSQGTPLSEEDPE